jgi:hypothetical protein
MSDALIRWYSIDADLQLQEHAPVNLPRAIEIATEYYARGPGTHESGEEALSATTFGFSRSPTEFVEFCAHGWTEISCRYESADPGASWLRKTFGGTFRHESTLRSKDALTRRIEQFFTLGPAAIRTRLENAS